MPAAYSLMSAVASLMGSLRRSLRFLLLEELADRAPHVLPRAERAHADRQAFRLELGEELGELRFARPEGGDAAGLDVAGVVELRRELGERLRGALAILGGILAVGG